MSVAALPAPSPADLAQVPHAELSERAWAARRALGDRLVVLGHHYQRDDVIAFADHTGDSFLLARRGAEATRADLILFLGVYFMAEAADVLAAPHQRVVLPDLGAGCHLAECADIFTVRDAWTRIRALAPGRSPVPLTYMNSGADLKAFVGEHGGAVCTSGNARRAFDWALELGSPVVFFPDEHLGRNTGARLGLLEREMPVWDPAREDGGFTAAELAEARVVLWKGFCNVHTRFTPAHVAAARAGYPGVRVVAHPECPRPVVDLADEVGSTEAIIRYCDEAPEGAVIAVGTDWNLVNRLRERHAPAKTVVCLREDLCPCVTMNRITLPALTWCLEAMAAGDVPNVVSVPPGMAHHARVALQRMLSLPG